MIILLTIIVFLCDYSLGTSNKLPPEFKICRRDEADINACFKEAVKIALPLLKNGIPDFNIPPADPLFVEAMTITGKGAVNVDQHFKNMNIFHLTEGVIDDVDLFLEEDIITATIKGTLGYCTVISEYNLDGKVLMVPIAGSGKATMELNNTIVTITLSGAKIQKKGVDHGQITDLNVDLNPSGVHIQLDNLFNGDEALGNQMNKLINENWKDLFAEIKNDYNVALATVIKNVAAQIFNKVPLDDLFPR